MLVGVGGSGKQSLTRVASFVAGYECVQIEINRGYGLPEFREDIKKLMVRLTYTRTLSTQRASNCGFDSSDGGTGLRISIHSTVLYILVSQSSRCLALLQQHKVFNRVCGEGVLAFS